MSTNYFYQKNNELIEHPLNKKFEEILWMNQDEFRSWWKDLRKLIVQLWDEKGLPPRVGYDEREIVEQFNKIVGFPVSEFVCVDELSGEENVIRNTSVVGNAANQFFETMMKTKINYTNDKDAGLSIYDHFASDDLFEKTLKYAKRNFKRDSFYHYSNPVRTNDHDLKRSLIIAQTGKEWIEKFEASKRLYGTHDYWLEPKEESDYTGYCDKLRDVSWLKLSKQELKDLGSLVPDTCKTHLNSKKGEYYSIRLYEYGQRLLPLGLKAFRVSWCQYAVNFPPLTAKFLYEEYTKNLTKQEQIVVYDPSSGWGGRLLGAMGVSRDRNIHYVGTDPNTDHTTKNGRTKYHELADFYNNKKARPLFAHNNTYEIYQLGSEEIHKNKDFRKWKGKVDLVFTSPPYFSKEVYSDDVAQSCHKFSTYDSWRDGFLRPTLETCVSWLKPGGHIIWNISDAKFGKDMLPLEKDSCDILKELGMKYIKTWKMALSSMPGGNRVVDDKPTAKNFVKVDGMFLKYEPCMVFQK